MTLYPIIIETLAFLALVALAGAVFLLVQAPGAGGRRRLRAWFTGNERHPLGWAALAAALATAGSLYLSEGVGLIPCRLCWYQRFVMYPLALLLVVAWARSSFGVWKLALPASLIGLAISVYHVAIQFQPALEVTSCDAAAPCSARYVAVFGFVSIPWLAGSVFLLVAALMIALALVSARDAEAVGTGMD